jgi:hypothetical protein
MQSAGLHVFQTSAAHRILCDLHTSRCLRKAGFHLCLNAREEAQNGAFHRFAADAEPGEISSPA